MSIEKCKSMLFSLAINHGVSPKLISTRLLSLEDKNDMLAGVFSLETLDCFVREWKANGMRNYADGTGELYSDFNRYMALCGTNDHVEGSNSLKVKRSNKIDT